VTSGYLNKKIGFAAGNGFFDQSREGKSRIEKGFSSGVAPSVDAYRHPHIRNYPTKKSNNIPSLKTLSAKID
jgi:hypothetical protein